jgi:CDP-diacylglycerol--serine O-phosphatidyltransferase
MDGRVARMTNTQSAFGEQYDSLSDLVSFGVAPAILVFSWSLQTLGKFGWICAFIYTVCAAFRLARFNVQIGSVDKRYFIGLASPLAAAIIASMVWAGFDNQMPNKLKEFAIVASVITVFTGFLMVSNFKFYSFKELDRSRVPFAMMLPVVLVMGIVTYDLPIGLLAVSVVYALSAPLTAIWHKLRPTKKAIAIIQSSGAKEKSMLIQTHQFPCPTQAHHPRVYLSRTPKLLKSLGYIGAGSLLLPYQCASSSSL